MKIRLQREHREHLRKIGHRFAPFRLRCSEAEYREAAEAWKRSGIRNEAELHKKVIGHLAWKRKAARTQKWERGKWIAATIGFLLLLIVLTALPAHCQFSHIETISVTDGTHTNFSASPFKITFSGCTVGGSGSSWTISCTGTAANPGGSANQVQFNNAGTSFGGITNKAVGFFFGSAGTGALPTFQPKPYIDAFNDYAVDCTGVSASDTAIANAVAAGNQIVLPQGCIVNFASNHTFATSVSFLFYAGAEFSPQSGVSIIVNGPTFAGDRQQIVNTANGTVSFYGNAEIPCGWYGSLQDLVHDDAPGCHAANAANPGKFIYLTPINPHNTGVNCCTAGPDALFLSQFVLRGNGSSFGFKGATHKVQDGGAWISVPNTLGTPAIFVSGNCYSCALRHVFVRGPAASAWTNSALTTFMLYTETALDGLDNDGININGGHFTGEDIGAQNFLRHGIFVCGDATCIDSLNSVSGQPDYWYINGCSMAGNRGFGLYATGGDAGGGKAINCGGSGNGYGAIGDWVGAGGGPNIYYTPGDESSAQDIISAGTTQAVSSISVVSTTCTLTTTAALANGINTNNTWIVVAGSTGGTNFNGTFQVTSFNNVAQTLTYPCTATGGPASGGTVGTQSGRLVWNYLATVYSSGGLPVTPGYSFTTGPGQVVIMNPFSEPAPTKWGSGSTIVIQGQNAQNLFAAGQKATLFQSGSSGTSFGLPALSTSNMNLFGLQDAELDLNLQNGVTADQTTSVVFYTHATPGTLGTANFTIGQWLGGYFRINSSNINAGNYLLAQASTGTLGLSSLGSGDVTFGNTNFSNGTLGSGNVTFFGNSASLKAEIDHAGNGIFAGLTVNGTAWVGNTTTSVGTTTINANTCTAATTVTMTGVVTTSTFAFSPNADITGVTGWGSTGGLTIVAWPTANTLNYKVCNQTGSNITPSSSVTFNVSAK